MYTKKGGGTRGWVGMRGKSANKDDSLSLSLFP